jgi:hypothetical protein
LRHIRWLRNIVVVVFRLIEVLLRSQSSVFSSLRHQFFALLVAQAAWGKKRSAKSDAHWSLNEGSLL